jgi:hypothetical protein
MAGVTFTQAAPVQVGVEVKQWTTVNSGVRWTPAAVGVAVAVPATAAGYIKTRMKVELGFTADKNVFIIGQSLIGPSSPVLGGAPRTMWTDVTDHVQSSSIHVSRGATRGGTPWWRADGGSCSFQLDNNDGSDQFNPRNLSGPYVAAGISQCKPGLMVRVSITNGTHSSPIFTGSVDEWRMDFSSDKMSSVTVRALDGVEKLQSVDLGAVATPTFVGDLGPVRVGRLLDRAQWPSTWRKMSTKTNGSTLQATVMAQAVWSEILLTADSDGALVFQDMSGDIVYWTRDDFEASGGEAFSTAGAYSDHIVDVNTSFDRKQVWNIAAFGRVGGVQRYVEDAASTSTDANGPRAVNRTDLICQTDAQVDTVANEVVAQYGDLVFRIEDFSLQLKNDDICETWWKFATMEVGRRIQFTYHTPSSNATLPNAILTYGFVRGLQWTENQGGAVLIVSLQNTLFAAPSRLADPVRVAVAVPRATVQGVLVP